MSISFDSFCKAAKDQLDDKSYNKGYCENGPDGENELYEFIERRIGIVPHAHALGEIVYKVVRFARKQDPEDLEKIAAWAYLVYKYAREKRKRCGKIKESTGKV